MKKVTLVLKKEASVFFQKKKLKGSKCYYLAGDYLCFMKLQEEFVSRIKINNLSGLFDKVFREIKQDLLKIMFQINKENNSFEWWGGQLASKNIQPTELFLNLTYFSCAQKILSEGVEDIIFIVNSIALSKCIEEISKKNGHYVVNCCQGIFHKVGFNLKRYGHYILQIGSFFVQVLRCRYLAWKVLTPFSEKKSSFKKRILIRSWVTQDTLKNSEKFVDRNFGNLPNVLRSKGYEVWVLPMFFNVSMPMKEMFEYMRKSTQSFLVPELYLRLWDYMEVLYNSFKVFSREIKGVELGGIDVSSLFNEALKIRGFNVAISLLNLQCFVLKRLKQKGFKIDNFYYAFESNASEKQFILSVRKYFSKSKIMGFQHSVFYTNQLAVHLFPEEEKFHPLPDKIICSGDIYLDLYKRAGFPKDILIKGVNLRFGSIHPCGWNSQKINRNKKKMIFLPLIFNHEYTFELLVKMKKALNDMEKYVVYIKNHPLLSKKILRDFLHKISFKNYEFAEGKSMQEWLSEAYCVISSGASVTILEAVCLGVPTIRLIPDNIFFYDPFTYAEYPLKPINAVQDIQQQLQLIEDIYRKDPDMFLNISHRVFKNYFAEMNEENLKVFMNN